MTTIINRYIGITHPLTNEVLEEEQYNLILKAWKTANCPSGIHLWDEVISDDDHYLHCDACGIEVHINKIVIPDGKDTVIDNSKGKK